MTPASRGLNGDRLWPHQSAVADLPVVCDELNLPGLKIDAADGAVPVASTVRIGDDEIPDAVDRFDSAAGWVSPRPVADGRVAAERRPDASLCIDKPDGAVSVGAGVRIDDGENFLRRRRVLWAGPGDVDQRGGSGTIFKRLEGKPTRARSTFNLQAVTGSGATHRFVH
jgi:hypothetical protein